jgi:hypothetical protein
MKRLLVLVLLAGCACGKKDGTGPGGGGGGGGTGTGTGTGTAADCEAVKPHVEELYAGAETAADDVAMVMKDCAADPGRVAACARDAKTAADLEQRCLIPIDDEGSEGDRFK